jgi:hypothetical protein
MNSNLFIYYREKIFYLLDENKKKTEGVFSSEADIEPFLKSRKIKNVFLVFSKSKIFTRTISFPFSSISKISLVLENEISDLFPVALSQLNIYWFLSRKEKDSSEVTIFAVDKTIIILWQTLQKKYHFKIQISFEGFVLLNLIKQKHLELKNYSIIFIDSGYIVLYRIQNGIITNIISSFFENDENIKNFSKYTLDIPVKETIYIVGNLDKSYSLGLGALSQQVSVSSLFSNTFLFNLVSPLAVKTPFKIYQLKKRYYIPVSYFVFGFIYICILFLLIQPFFTARRYQEKVNKINKQEDSIFRQQFPDIKNIVDPVLQAEDKVKTFNTKGMDIIPVSPLKIMSEIVKIVPNSINFSVSQISISNNQVFLSCQTDSLGSLDKIDSLFKKDKFFSDIKQGNISLSDGKVEFNIILTIADYKNGKSSVKKK